jgi:hypothetical protein
MAGKHAKEQRAWREAFLLNMQIMDGLPNQIGLAIQAADSVSPFRAHRIDLVTHEQSSLIANGKPVSYKVTKQLKLPRNTRDYFVVRTWEMHRNPINSFNQYAKQIQWVWVSRTYRVSDGAQRLSERSHVTTEKWEP